MAANPLASMAVLVFFFITFVMVTLLTTAMVCVSMLILELFELASFCDFLLSLFLRSSCLGNRC